MNDINKAAVPAIEESYQEYKCSTPLDVDYEAELQKIYANPCPAQAKLIADDLKHRQKNAAMITILNAWSPYEFDISATVNQAVVDPQELQRYSKWWLKTVDQTLVELVIHPDNKLKMKNTAILQGYFTVERGYPIRIHIVCRAATGLAQIGLQEVTDVFIRSTAHVVMSGTAIPVFNPDQLVVSPIKDGDDGELLAKHCLQAISGSNNDGRLHHGPGIYRMFGSRLERWF